MPLLGSARMTVVASAVEGESRPSRKASHKAEKAASMALATKTQRWPSLLNQPAASERNHAAIPPAALFSCVGEAAEGRLMVWVGLCKCF